VKKNDIESDDPDILGSLPAMRRAARRALQIGRETGTPVYVMKRGKIVDYLAEEKARQERKAKKKVK
jgi:hypothetical protein